MATKKATASTAASSDREQQTAYIDAILDKLVSSGFTAGISAYVERGGQPLYRGMTGLADIASGRRITDDTIFRIFSMSKVFTVTAALILYERGLYRMYDPISRFIPAYKNAKVFETGPDGKPYARPATREILVRDLFTMTSGIPYGGTESETERRIGRMMAREERTIAAGGTPSDTLRVAEKIAAIPLEFDPGDHWKYGMSLDVLGALVTVWSGKTLGTFVQEELAGPLGMSDTGFYVPEDKLSRLASMYPVGPGGKILPDAVSRGVPTAPPAYESGGGGMFSTVSDYAALARMLLTGKAPDGRQILSRKTIELMRADHLTDKQKKTYNWDTQHGYSYGLGVRTLVDIAAAGANGSVGEFGWDGYAGTWMCVDPSEDLCAVFMTQRAPGGHVESVPLFKAAFYALL